MYVPFTRVSTSRGLAQTIARIVRPTAHMMPNRQSRSLLVFLLGAALVPVHAPAQRSKSGIDRERVFKAIGLREGLTVCEVGAGDGEMTLSAARLVGPNGRVYSNELGDGRVKKLQDKIAASGVTNIVVVPGDPGRTNFPDAVCDAIFMHDVYHHLADPEAMNRSLLAALKPGGRVAIVDFKPPGQEAARPADRAKDGMHGVSPDTVTREMKNAGFEPVTSETGWRWFLIIFAEKRPT